MTYMTNIELAEQLKTYIDEKFKTSNEFTKNLILNHTITCPANNGKFVTKDSLYKTLAIVVPVTAILVTILFNVLNLAIK